MRAFKDTAHYTDGNEMVSECVRMCVTYIQLFLYFSIGVFFFWDQRERERANKKWENGNDMEKLTNVTFNYSSQN